MLVDEKNVTYAFTPKHSWYGYTAPTIYVTVPNSQQSYMTAMKIAKQNTLLTRFLDKWELQ